MLKQLLARKTDFSDADDANGPTLRRTLGPIGLTARKSEPSLSTVLVGGSTSR